MSFFDKSKLEKHIFNNIKNKIKKLKLSKEFKESYSSKENFIKKEILENSEIQEKIDDLIDTINTGVRKSIGNILRINSRTRKATNSMSFIDKSKLEKHILDNINNKIKHLKLSQEFKKNYSSKKKIVKKEILEQEEIQEKIDDLINTIDIGVQNSIGTILRINSRTRKATNSNTKTKRILRFPKLVNIKI